MYSILTVVNPFHSFLASFDSEFFDDWLFTKNQSFRSAMSVSDFSELVLTILTR